MKRKPLSLKFIQWVTWIILLAIHFLSLLPYDPVGQSLLYSSINIGTYLLIIYGNASFLLPKLYSKGRRVAYVVAVMVLIPVVAFLRFCVSIVVYNSFFAEKPTPFRWSGVVSSGITVTLVFISSILFYIALDFFRLKRKQEQLQKRHAEAELNLLKAQVQPHFLFNTLNNIYFVAQRESPRTAMLLEQLSQIMRYFVDEAPKDRISLSTELAFIHSYIELEKMRMRYPLQVSIDNSLLSEHIQVPPMLLIPLVENVFKHGIDKLRDDNFIRMKLTSNGDRLNISVENRVASHLEKQQGTGLRNLTSRLYLLFEKDYHLQTSILDGIFHAQLNIPL